MNRVVQWLVILGLVIPGAGCVSNLPKEITTAPVPDISLADTQKDIKSYKDKLVRWGGIIITVENLPKKTVLEILAKPLNSSGQPAINVTSTGRFYAEIDGFIDPSVYAPGRELTLFGTVTELRTHKIGEHVYHYPVIKVTKHHIWEFAPRAGYYDPYWDDYYYWGYTGPWLWFYWGHYDTYGHHFLHHH